MNHLKICVNSQTPLVRFKLGMKQLVEKYGEHIKYWKSLPLSLFREGEDYNFTPGGVARMVYPLLVEFQKNGFAKKPYWVALNPLAPRVLDVEGIRLYSIKLEPETLRGYGRTKEVIWRRMHNLTEGSYGKKWVKGGLGELPNFGDYTQYNWSCVRKMFQIIANEDIDVFYIHDFQQLQVGFMLGPSLPKVFRWHIPFYSNAPKSIVRYLESFDAVIVSTNQYLKALKRCKFRGTAYQVYPHLDEKAFGNPKASEIEEFKARYNIKEDDRIITLIARLDPMKGQDRAIRAVKSVSDEFPDVKLMIIGNGSFSSSKRGGIGLSKGEKWMEKLQDIVHRDKLEDKVIFTGYVPDDEIKCAYNICEFNMLPSLLEGFGLTVIEGWLYKKPSIVSSQCGVAELIKDGRNSFVFRNQNELVQKLGILLRDSKLQADMGVEGYETAKNCYLERGMDKVGDILSSVIEV